MMASVYNGHFWDTLLHFSRHFFTLQIFTYDDEDDGNGRPSFDIPPASISSILDIFICYPRI
jgi:hypothetical protein